MLHDANFSVPVQLKPTQELYDRHLHAAWRVSDPESVFTAQAPSLLATHVLESTFRAMHRTFPQLATRVGKQCGVRVADRASVDSEYVAVRARAAHIAELTAAGRDRRQGDTGGDSQPPPPPPTRPPTGRPTTRPPTRRPTGRPTVQCPSNYCQNQLGPPNFFGCFNVCVFL